MIRLIILAVSALGSLAAASADPTGTWSFETTSKIKGCTITGNMTISQSFEGARDCSFISQEICENEPLQAITMDQVCSIRQQADTSHLEIQSTVLASLVDGYNTSNYLPDNFYLDDISDDRMTGMWWDTNFSAPVIFWREKAIPAS